MTRAGILVATTVPLLLLGTALRTGDAAGARELPTPKNPLLGTWTLSLLPADRERWPSAIRLQRQEPGNAGRSPPVVGWNHATGFEPDGHREGGVAQSRWRLRSARTTKAVAP